ncbi:hypothetical protein LINGRAHAP2_LOCUS10707 [Linum grandiflorum]
MIDLSYVLHCFICLYFLNFLCSSSFCDFVRIYFLDFCVLRVLETNICDIVCISFGFFVSLLFLCYIYLQIRTYVLYMFTDTNVCVMYIYIYERLNILIISYVSHTQTFVHFSSSNICID